MLVEQSTMLGAKDLLIATSFRPYAQQTADIVNEAHGRGAKIIALSDSRLSPIARNADLCLEVKDAEYRKFRSLTASLCLAQTLVISYAFQVTAGREAGGDA
jgi:DNA-binding MurR/RpiR family transcriptional regulator